MPFRDKPIKRWVADFETRGFQGEFSIGYIWDGEQGEFYYSVTQFIEICNNIGLKYAENLNVIYFHNMDYDSRYFIVDNIMHIDTMKSLFIDNNLCVIKFKKSLGPGFRNIEFRDSLKLFQGGDPADLHSVTDAFGVEHVKMEKVTQFKKYEIECQYKKKYACGGWTEKKTKSDCPYFNECSDEYFRKVRIDDEWFREYCAVDCKGLHEALNVFHDQVKAIARADIKLGYTLASTAMRIYRQMNQGKYDIVMMNKRMEENNGCLKMVREAYRGGRCEVYKRYGRNLHSYDVNSLYPSVMYDFTYPLNPSPPQPCTIEEFSWMKKGRDYIVHATVQAPNILIPILSVNMPVPGKKEVKYLFPVGELEGYWCSPEFEHALSKGYQIKTIHEVIWYGGRAEFFKEYVAILHKIKQESKGAKRQTAKLLLNSLYGKFGQRDQVHRMKFMTPLDFDVFAMEEDENGEPVNHLLQSRSIDQNTVLVEYVGESHMRHNYVSLAAFITSQARLRLYKYIEQCNNLGGQIWYVDTDSLKTDVYMPAEKDENGRVKGMELGLLKHEYDILEGIFLRPKMYGCMKEVTVEGDEIAEIKNKGVMKKVLINLNMEEMRKWLFMQKVEVIPPGTPGAVRMPKVRDIIYGKARFGEMKRVVKTQILVDDKRGIDQNTIDTFPLGYEGPRIDQLGRRIYGRGPMNKDIAEEQRERGAVA